MLRTFLCLALAGGALVVAAFAFALREQAHPTIGTAAAVATLAVHATAQALLFAAARRMRMMVQDHGLPAWVNDQAGKNRRKPLRVGLAGAALAGTFAWPGSGPWYAAACGFAAAFNLGTFVAELAAIFAQERLAREVGGPVQRLGGRVATTPGQGTRCA